MREFKIPIHQPYDFKMVLAFLKRHEAFGIEEVGEECYLRYVPVDDGYRVIKVMMSESGDALSVLCQDDDLEKIKHLFDTDHNPKTLPKLTGIRVVGCYDPYEVAVSIILGQLISVVGATKKLAQLIKEFGKDSRDNIYHFPTPKKLIDAPLETLGITKAKSSAIRSLSLASYHDKIFLEDDFSKARERLLSIKGIGPWTTEMIMMRCFKDRDAFATNDLFIQKAIKENIVDEELWISNRAYLTHYIWNKGV